MMILDQAINLLQILAIIAAAVIAYKAEIKAARIGKMLKEDKKDLPLLLMDLKFFNNLRDIIEEMFNKTKADRFLVLVATNGRSDFKFATAIYEHHKFIDQNTVKLSVGGTSKYVRFRFDKAYLQMLKESEIRDKVSLSTNEMPESDLKDIYLTENIKDSEVYFLKREKIDENNDVIFYCFIATYNSEGYSRADKTLIKTYMDGVKDLINDHSLTS